MTVYSRAMLTVAAAVHLYVSQDIDQRECCWVNLMLLPSITRAEWLNMYIDEPANWKAE
jgi:hypothetical protein